MTAALPDWHKLIAAWLARGRYGLTIPFVVGARATLAGASSANRADIQALFQEIIHEPVANFVVYPRWCADMDSVVLATYALDFPHRPKYNLIEFQSQSQGQLSMAAEANLATKLGVKPTPGGLLEALISHALPHVERGNFSRFWTHEGRENGPFQAEDIAFIGETSPRNAS